MVMENAFGLRLYEIKDLLKDIIVENAIGHTLRSVFNCLGIVSEQSKAIITECLLLANNYKLLSDYEKETHKILEQAGITELIPQKLEGRAKVIFNQINQHLIPGSILDLGCGDGNVSELLAKDGYRIVLSDIYKNSNIDSTGLEFRQVRQSGDIPAYDNEFDNSLALNVLHHCSNPLKTLSELYRITKNNGRVLIIESVYAVDGTRLSFEMKKELQVFLHLNSKQQRMINIFFDHFYNRLINYSENHSVKANIPFNFNTPERWEKIFNDRGFIQEKVLHLGMDQPIVPEYHTLHILKVKK